MRCPCPSPLLRTCFVGDRKDNSLSYIAIHWADLHLIALFTRRTYTDRLHLCHTVYRFHPITFRAFPSPAQNFGSPRPLFRCLPRPPPRLSPAFDILLPSPSMPLIPPPCPIMFPPPAMPARTSLTTANIYVGQTARTYLSVTFSSAERVS